MIITNNEITHTKDGVEIPVNLRPRFISGRYEGRLVSDVLIINPSYVKQMNREGKLALNPYLKQLIAIN